MQKSISVNVEKAAGGYVVKIHTQASPELRVYTNPYKMLAEIGLRIADQMDLEIADIFCLRTVT